MTPHRDYEIIRHKESDYATFGRMFDANGLIVCVTLERPWVDVNADSIRDPNVSRFEAGLYRATLRKSHLNGGTGKRGYDVWQFVDAPDIEAGQIHRATWPWELEGCVALGSGFGDVQYMGDTITTGTHPRKRGAMYPGITGSRNAFDKFMTDSLALCARENRDEPYLVISVVDRFTAPPSA